MENSMPVLLAEMRSSNVVVKIVCPMLNAIHHATECYLVRRICQNDVNPKTDDGCEWHPMAVQQVAMGNMKIATTDCQRMRECYTGHKKIWNGVSARNLSGKSTNKQLALVLSSSTTQIWNPPPPPTHPYPPPFPEKQNQSFSARCRHVAHIIVANRCYQLFGRPSSAICGRAHQPKSNENSMCLAEFELEFI